MKPRPRCSPLWDATYGVFQATGKQDFNAATHHFAGEFLVRKGSALGFSLAAGDKYQQLAKAILAYRDKRPETASSQASMPSAKVNGRHASRDLGAQRRFPSPRALRHPPNAEIGQCQGGWRVTQIRPSELPSMLWRAMLVYIAFPVRVGLRSGGGFWRVFHDVLITLGLFKIFGFEISADGHRSFAYPWLVTR